MTAEETIYAQKALLRRQARRIKELGAKVARLEAPETDAEWDAHAVPGNSLVRGIDRISFRIIIAARAKEPTSTP